MRDNCRHSWKEAGHIFIYIILSTNLESTLALLDTENESTEPMPSRYTWEGLFAKCTNHQKEAGGRLLEQKQCSEMHRVKEHSWGEAMQWRWQNQQKYSLLPPLPTPAPITKEQSLAKDANQPVLPEADKWEGNNLVRATQGVKATGAFRNREQLVCFEHAAAPTPIRLASTLCMPSTAVSQGSSVTLILFSLTVCLASSRCNIPAWGWRNNKGLISL